MPVLASEALKKIRSGQLTLGLCTIDAGRLDYIAFYRSPEHLIDLKADGSFWLDMGYFDYVQGLTMTGAFTSCSGARRAPRNRHFV